MTWRGAAGCVCVAILFGSAPPVAADIDESQILCIECHMDVQDKHVALIEEWRTSVHYEQGITCGQCHQMSDADFDAIPDPGERAHVAPNAAMTLKMCAQCHSDWMDYYPLSAHFQDERVSCVMCHGGADNNHAIQRASLDIITEERCATCHDYAWAQEAGTAFRETVRAHAALEASLANIAANDYHSTRLERLHEAADTLQEHVPLELHTFQLKRIKAIARSITDIESAIRGEEERILAKVVTQKRRQTIGMAILVTCPILSVLILAFRKTYIEEWHAVHGRPRNDP